MADRWTRLATLAPTAPTCSRGRSCSCRPISGTKSWPGRCRRCYDRGAKFVDVNYFDPYVKRARIEHADPDTLEFVPSWYGDRFTEHAKDTERA
jgi:Leucyl aminopeptidase (aminopeptidase T)